MGRALRLAVAISLAGSAAGFLLPPHSCLRQVVGRAAQRGAEAWRMSSDDGDDGWGDDDAAALEQAKREAEARLAAKKPEGAKKKPSASFVPRGRIEENPIIAPDKYDNIPGKIKVDEVTLAKQQAGLEKIARQLRRERLDYEAENSVLFGFVEPAEIINGRTPSSAFQSLGAPPCKACDRTTEAAMFGITVGLLTEIWTGQSIPQQVETLLSNLGILPLDYESYFGG